MSLRYNITNNYTYFLTAHPLDKAINNTKGIILFEILLVYIKKVT